jgi:hypothetical protein
MPVFAIVLEFAISSFTHVEFAQGMVKEVALCSIGTFPILRVIVTYFRMSKNAFPFSVFAYSL